MADERRTVLRQAYELARSGDFADEQSIEAVLARDDPAASEWLKSPSSVKACDTCSTSLVLSGVRKWVALKLEPLPLALRRC